MLRDLFFIVFCFAFPTFSEQRGTWNPSGGYEYYVSPKAVSKSYDDSQKFCEGNDGQLALVKTESVHNFITTLVSDGSGTPYAFFIGLRDVHGNGTFEWDDGSSLGFKRWHPSEPNNIGTETCVQMGQRYTYDEHLKWYNVVCVIGTAGSAGFVCQRKIGWHWSQWTEMSICKCSGLQKRTRNCVYSTRPGPYVCNETDVETETQPCSPATTCSTEEPTRDGLFTSDKTVVMATETMQNSSSTSATTTKETTGLPVFIPVVACITGLLFLILIAIIFWVIRKRLAKAVVNAGATTDAHSNEATHEYETIDALNQQGDAGRQYEIMNGSAPMDPSGYCTVDFQNSSSTYVNSGNHIVREPVEDSGRGYVNIRMACSGDNEQTEPAYMTPIPLVRLEGDEKK